MGQPANLNRRIIESLYAEGLMLSDEVRTAFDLTHRANDNAGGNPEDETRVALSCEALRTTTRMMHAVAWLLNHRAFLNGEISEFQLRRHGRIAANLPLSDPARLPLLDPEVQDLIRATERFYARLVRLDTGWREREPMATGPAAAPAIQRLRERLARAVR
jgi:regulator of CtrA degradation